MPSCMVCISFSSRLYTERHLFFSLILKNADCHVFYVSNADTESSTKRECFSVPSRERYSKDNRNITKVDLVRHEICHRMLLLLKSKCCSRCANTTRKFAVCRSLCLALIFLFQFFSHLTWFLNHLQTIPTTLDPFFNLLYWHDI